MPPPVYPAGSYPARIVADGASNYWRLNETSGTSAVDVIGGATGTISGGVTLNQPGALADGDTAMGFNGSTGKVVTAGSVTATPPFTIEAWANHNESLQRPCVEIQVAIGTFYYFGVTGSTPFFYAAPGGPATGTRNTRVGWHHLVYVVTSTTSVSLYVDGVFDRSQTVAGVISITGPASLGWSGNTGEFLTGALDDVAIYPRALTAPEIAAHYALRTFSASAWRGVPWWVAIQGEDALDSFNLWEPITPSDTVNLPRGVSGGVWVGAGGDIAAVMGNNVMPVVLAAVPAGSWLPLAAKRINATGTTATGLVALYEI